jgi:heat shock protein beta
LKEDAIEYVESDKIKELVKRYSQFINYPIYLWVSKDVTKQVAEEDYNDDVNTYEDVPDEELENEELKVEDYKRKEGGPVPPKKDGEAEDDVEVKEASEDAEGNGEPEKPKESTAKTITETVWDWELINDVKAIWLRPKSEIEDKEYFQFYKSISKDNENPLTHSHFTAEGDIEFKSILFIPGHATHDMFENYYGKTGSMKLYVRKVLISD